MKRGMCVSLLFTFPLLAGCSFDRPSDPIRVDEGVSSTMVIQCPFSDFLSTQGTFCWPDGQGGCFDFEPPLKNFLGWSDQDYLRSAFFEYLGQADAWLQEQSQGAISLGTEITGTVTKRPLDDGRALIHIRLHARNILVWVTQIEDYYLDPLVFGARVTDVLAGAPPALGDFHMELQFINTSQNAPIPDLVQLHLMPEPGQEILHTSLNMSATGVFHEGSGFPEGTCGRVNVTQVYPPLPDSEYVTGWSVERIDMHPQHCD